ncbi:MAG: hypothetical protein H6867_08460 [Rhodospirillales bacterium]|nr:hypothetical protein [Rhodospirillales bacterium]MCB9995585.1 hypothetical protein [Rhodospirillales bacterium]
MCNIPKLTKIFSATAGVLMLAGCASPMLNKSTCMEEKQTNILFGLFSNGERHYNKGCALELGARQMLLSDDIGMKALGHALLEKQQGDIEDVSGIVRQVIVEETTLGLDCEVQSAERGVDGKKIIRLGNCTPLSP